MNQRKYGWPPPQMKFTGQGVSVAKVVLFDPSNVMLCEHTFTPIHMRPGDNLNLNYNFMYQTNGFSATP